MRLTQEKAIASINPATGELLRTFEPLPDSAIEARLQRAAAAFSGYRLMPVEERARHMTSLAEILERDKETLARLMTQEMGKPIRAARDEVAKCVWACRYFSEQAPRLLADHFVTTHAGRSYIRYQPLGPILAIMPWNFPLWQVFRFAVPGLMAGNVCLLKHAPSVPQCALQVERLFLEAGFPEGVMQTLLVEVEQVDAILSDPRVAAATLTGSERAGMEVGVGAAKRIKKVVLELGGSDPFLVMPSADLEAAVSTAVKARIVNNGQSCIAAKRFILAEPIADRFEREFVKRMAALKVGDPLDESTDLGPLVTAEAVARLDEQVRKTVASGARVLTGGHRLPGAGNYYPPTVLADVPPASPAYTDELFGPVASLFRVRDVDAAIRLANDTRFGLGASVWTRDPMERGRFLRDLQAGMIFFNGMVASDPRLPFGGTKRSGHGRELGAFGLYEFTNIQTVWIQEAP